MIIPNGFGQISARFSFPGLERDQFVVYGFRNDSILTNPSDLADYHLAIWETNIAVNQDNQCQIGPFICSLGTATDPLTGEGTDTATGGSSFNCLPANVATLVKKSSSTPGRRGRGRMYIPWYMPDEAVDERGTIDPTSFDVRQADITAFYDNLVSGDVPMVILHNTVGAPSIVTALTVDRTVATQRRRLRK